MSSLSDFLENQQGEGKLDSSGAFSIDFVKAREKLSQFALPHYSDYLLKLCQFANLTGTHRLDCQIRPGRVTLSFLGGNGEVSVRQVREGLLSTASASHSPALKALLLGLNGALALAPANLEVRDRRSGRMMIKADGVHLEDEPADDAEEQRSLDTPEHESPGAAGGEHIEPDCVFFVELLRKRDSAAAKTEHAALQERCCYGSTEIWLNGQALLPVIPAFLTSEAPSLLPDDFILGERRLVSTTQGLRLPAWPAEVGDARDPERKVFLRQLRGGGSDRPASHWILLRYGRRSGRIALAQHGVVVDVLDGACRISGVDAVVDASGLATDLSGLQVMESEGLERLKQLVWEQAYELSQDVLANVDRLYATVPPSAFREDTSDHSCLATVVGLPLGCMSGPLLVAILPQFTSKVAQDSWVTVLTFLIVTPLLIWRIKRRLINSRFFSNRLWKPLDQSLRYGVRQRLSQQVASASTGRAVVAPEIEESDTKETL